VKVNELQYELITKHLTSEITEDEKIMLNNELSENLELRQKKEILHYFWFNFFPKSLSHRIIQKTEKKLGFSYRLQSRFSLGFIYKVAATLLLILSFGYIGLQYFKPAIETSLNEYTTKSGEVKNIVLSDGTKVWLNTRSMLIASEPFVESTREVLLIGEGYFEVAHNADKPFIIKTSLITTKVLGTHFNISAYPGDNNFDVTLYEGKVELSESNSPNNLTIMKPGEKTSFSGQDRNFYVNKIDIAKPAEWREGIIRFDDENLNSISKILERKFSTKIFILDEEVGKLRFTANFETEPLDKILNLLSEAHEFKTIKTTNGIIIKSIKNNI